jgi:hypothetical protein
MKKARRIYDVLLVAWFMIPVVNTRFSAGSITPIGQILVISGSIYLGSVRNMLLLALEVHKCCSS